MQKMILSLSFILVFGLTAIPTDTVSYAVETSGAVADVGNQFCPVSGDQVSGKHFVEHEGKRYGLCCPMCANKFKRNPGKYIAEMNAQEPKAAESASADASTEIETMPHEHKGHAH